MGQTRNADTAELARQRRNLQRYSVITLLLVAGGVILNMSTDSDATRLIGMLPAVLGAAALVWLMHRYQVASTRHEGHQDDGTVD